MRRLILGAVALLVLFGSGCGQRTANVHGTIRYQGKPLANASILFVANGRAYPARIHADGSYTLTDLPQGRVEVAIQMEEPRTPARPAPDLSRPEDAKALREMAADDAAKQHGRSAPVLPELVNGIPSKYTEPTTSGLGFELDTGDKDFSVDLK